MSAREICELFIWACLLFLFFVVLPGSIVFFFCAGIGAVICIVGLRFLASWMIGDRY